MNAIPSIEVGQAHGSELEMGGGGDPANGSRVRVAGAPGGTVTVGTEWSFKAPERVEIRVAVFMLSNIPDDMISAALTLAQNHVNKAKDLLFEHNLGLDVIRIGLKLDWLPRSVESDRYSREDMTADFASVQNAADAAMPRSSESGREFLGDRLQIVYAKFHDGEKLNWAGLAPQALPSRRRIAFLNIDNVAPDNVSLLHETIHCAGMPHRGMPRAGAPLPVMLELPTSAVSRTGIHATEVVALVQHARFWWERF
jgi:hypothetical protein